MKLVWSRRAQQEFEALERFSSERWGIPVAVRYLEDVLEAAEAVADDPRRARALRGAFRVKRVRSHYLAFHVDAQADQVTLVRILHVAQDLERPLPGEAD